MGTLDNMDQDQLRQHALIVRFVVAAFLVIFLMLGAVLIAAIGPSAKWNSSALLGFLVSATLAAPIFIAATPIAKRVSQSVVVRFYTRALIRLAAAILIAQLGMFLAFALSAGTTPMLLGGGTAVILLLLGVWPRRSTTTNGLN